MSPSAYVPRDRVLAVRFFRLLALKTLRPTGFETARALCLSVDQASLAICSMADLALPYDAGSAVDA